MEKQQQSPKTCYSNLARSVKSSLFERLCLIQPWTDFLLEAALQQPRHQEEAQDGESRQGHAEETEVVEILLVPEGVGQEDGEGAQGAEHGAVEVEARAVAGGHGEVGQQGAVVEVHHGEEAVVQTQAQQELQPGPGPRHPEGEEGQGEEGAICGESLQALQHHLWGRDRRARPGEETRNQQRET